MSEEWARIRKESVVAGSTRLNLNKYSIISCKSASSFYLKFLCIMEIYPAVPSLHRTLASWSMTRQCGPGYAEVSAIASIVGAKI